MSTFTIDIDNNITANLSAQDAEAMAGAETFRSEATLAKLAANWPAERLVEIWNGIPGVTPIKKFKDRKTGVSRIWRAIQTLVQEPQPTKPEAAPNPDAAKPKAKVAKKAAAEQQAAPNAEPATEEVQQPVEAVGTIAEPAPEEVPVVVEAVPISAEPAPEEVKQPEIADAASAVPAAAEPIQAADDNSPTEVTAAPAKTKSSEKAKSDGARAGSKAATILDLMKRAEGVTLKELMIATGWQAHSVRGFISGTLGKKMGLTVISAKGDNGERSYSLKA